MLDPVQWSSATLPTKHCLRPASAHVVADSLRPTVVPTEVWEADSTPPHIAGYEILGELGRGGGGVVYRARDQRLQRDVAIKMLHTHDSDADARRRFQAEAETVACLQHPNIVQIHEIAHLDGRPYLVLEFLAGGSLAGVLRGQPQSPTAAARMLEVLARAVHYAHEQAIIHRDLKPGNILITENRRTPHAPTLADVLAAERTDCIKIADFGIAKQLHLPAGHTLAGMALGTPGYTAPEQGSDIPVGPATDIYSLGAILYEFLTGRPPHQGVTPWDILMRSRTTEPLPPRRLQPHVPRDLETICLKCLAIQPDRRYTSAGAFADDLGRFLRHEPIHARPVSRCERAWKWVTRHPSTAAVVGVVALATMVTTVGGWLHSEQMRAERNRADSLKQAAEQAEERERQARFDMQRERDRVLVRYRSTRELVDRTVRRVAKLAESSPVLELEVQRRTLLEDASAFYRSYLEGTHPDEREPREATRAYLGLAMCLEALGKHDEAAANYERAAALLGDLVATTETRADLRMEIAMTQLDFAAHYQRTHHLDLAARHTNEGLAILRTLRRENQPSDHAWNALAEALTQRGVQHLQAGRLPEASSDLKEVATLRFEMHAAKPTSVTLFDSATAHMNLASVHKAQGNPKEAVQELQSATQLFAELVKKHAPHPDERNFHARLPHPLGRVDGPLLSHWPVAQRAAGEAARVRQRLVGTAYHGPESVLNLRNHVLGVVESAAQLLDHRQVIAKSVELTKQFPNDCAAQEVAFIAHVRASYLVHTDNTLTELEREYLAQIYCDQALEYLQRAVELGYRNVDFLKGNPNLALLEGRADYQALLRRIEK